MVPCRGFIIFYMEGGAVLNRTSAVANLLYILTPNSLCKCVVKSDCVQFSANLCKANPDPNKMQVSYDSDG